MRMLQVNRFDDRRAHGGGVAGAIPSLRNFPVGNGLVRADDPHGGYAISEKLSFPGQQRVPEWRP